MHFTLADIFPFLSERGRVEVDLAVTKAALERAQQESESLARQLTAKEPCDCGEGK